MYQILCDPEYYYETRNIRPSDSEGGVKIGLPYRSERGAAVITNGLNECAPFGTKPYRYERVPVETREPSLIIEG